MTGGTTTTTMTTMTTTRRLKADMTPQWQRFQQSIVMPTSGSANKTRKNQPHLSETIHPYQRQYSHVYQQRLRMLKPKCWQTFEETKTNTTTTPPPPPEIQQVNRILELQEDQLSVVVGTVIECYSFDNDTGDSSKDTEFVLEDESGRVTLLIEPDPTTPHHEHPQWWWFTGMVVAVQGCVLSDRVGMFRVDAQFMPHTTFPPPLQRRLPETSSSSSSSPHIMLVSGFQFGSPHVSSLPRDMLISYLQGHLGTNSGAHTMARVIICGGNCASAAEEEEKNNGRNSKLEAMKELDLFVSQLLASGIPVDVMPGADDPTTANWPQRPLHSSLLTQASTFTTPRVCRTPNPYMSSFSWDHHPKDDDDDEYEPPHPPIQIIGTDGLNMKDLVTRHEQKITTQLSKDTAQPNEKDDTRVSGTTPPSSSPPPWRMTELQALCHTLECHHICPTGPDSVPTVPHELEDPMVLSTKHHPHLYFGGNAQQGFDTVLWHNEVRVICVPSFAHTHQVCTVNLQTLEVEVLQFEE